MKGGDLYILTTFSQSADREPRQEKVQLSRYRYVNSKVIRYLARPPSPDPVSRRAGFTNDESRSGEARRILNGESPADHARNTHTKKNALSHRDIFLRGCNEIRAQE